MKRPTALCAALILCLLASAPLRGADGNPDPTFSEDGKQTIAFDDGQGNRDRGQAVTVFGSGRIVVVGDKQQVNVGDTDIAGAALNPNGELDSTFGNQGRASVYFDLGGDNEDRSNAVAAMKDGRFVLCGLATYQAPVSFETRLVVARFLPTGFIDPTFGPFDDGKVVLTPFSHADSSNGECRSIVAQDDGRIVVPFVNHPYFETGLIRLEEDGDLDPTFGGDGISELPVCASEGSRCELIEVLLLPGGKYMAIGTKVELIGQLYVKSVFFARYTSGGLLDTSFNGDGVATAYVPLESVQDLVHLPTAAALDPRGRVVVLGRVDGNGFNNLYFLVRIDANGVVDETFGFDGWANADWDESVLNSTDEVNGLFIQGDGKIVVTGFHQLSVTDYDCGAMRFNSIATVLDTSFGSAGRRFIAFDFGNVDDTDLCHALSAADGRPLLAGQVRVALDYDFGVARLTNAYIFIDGFEIGSRFFWSDSVP